jgi:hypothetical protein
MHLKVLKAGMRNLESSGHDSSDRLQAMALAQEYGKTLYTGVFYRNPEPPPTCGGQVADLKKSMAWRREPRERILDMFLPGELESGSEPAPDLGGE